MGKFKAAGVLVREINGLKLIFMPTQTIYVHNTRTKMTYCIHHWFHNRNGYHRNHWQYIDYALKYNQQITLDGIFRTAARHDATIQHGRLPDLANKTIITLPPEGRHKGKQAKC